jgi:hypothetical protein
MKIKGLAETVGKPGPRAVAAFIILVREGKGKFLEQFGSHQESSAASEISART